MGRGNDKVPDNTVVDGIVPKPVLILKSQKGIETFRMFYIL